MARERTAVRKNPSRRQDNDRFESSGVPTTYRMKTEVMMFPRVEFVVLMEVELFGTPLKPLEKRPALEDP